MSNLRNVPVPRPTGGSSRPNPAPPPRINAGAEKLEEVDDCPLCCTELDATDRRFKPCACGYQICAWCWHQLMERAVASHTVGRCPACRTDYDESTIQFDKPSEEELAAEAERLAKKPSRSDDGFTTVGGKSKGSGSNRPSMRLAERKRLFDVRVIRRNLVYVVGITPRFCNEKSLHELKMFQKFGNVLKIHATPPKPNSVLPTGSAYITFDDEQSAAECIRGVDGTTLDQKTLRASFGTTKYCTSFLKAQKCLNPNCLYLHDGGEDRDSFTKEEMLAQYGTKNTKAFQDAARSAAASGSVSHGSSSYNSSYHGDNTHHHHGPPNHHLNSNYQGKNFNPNYRFEPRDSNNSTSASGFNQRPTYQKPYSNDSSYQHDRTQSQVTGQGFSQGQYVEPRQNRGDNTTSLQRSSLRGGIPAPRLPVPRGIGQNETSDLNAGLASMLRIVNGGQCSNGHDTRQNKNGMYSSQSKNNPPPVPLGNPPPGAREKSRFGFAEDHN